MDEPPKTSMVKYIQPLGMRVLVRLVKEEDRHASGLYLPAGAKENHEDAFYGEVLEVARATSTDPQEEKSFGANVSGVPCGARVLFRKDAGVRVPWDDTLLLLDTKDVLATVEEVAPDAIQ
jgi:co-chaperonin GroES (HSP10)